MINSQDDVIAAIATPIGEGGISVIRISGKGAIELTDSVFRGKAVLSSSKTHTAHFGYFVDSTEQVIDEVVATVFRSPQSYTAEDSVEISCHGGMFVTRKILDTLVYRGARLAEPGEFTKRAFLNGRIDLSQAEAVADIIKSRSELSHRTSIQQLQGRLSLGIENIRSSLLNICSLLELELDFIEEGIEFTDTNRIIQDLRSTIRQLDDLIKSYETGKVYREGIKVVLVGKPNVGKSSILNTLLDENRAIVTDIPGTTRDVIEENLNIEGILFKIIDTAGIRESKDVVESEGIKRTRKEIGSSDIILFIVDSAVEFNQEDLAIYQEIGICKPNFSDSCIMIFNKIDISNVSSIADISRDLNPLRYVVLSAKTREGFSSLRKLMVEISVGDTKSNGEGSLIITNLRHKECLSAARESLGLALDSLADKKSNEFVSVDLRSALDYLGLITGRVSTEDILKNIFSRFCIGK